MDIPKRMGSIPIHPTSIVSQAKSYLGMRGEALKIGLFIDPRMSDETIDVLVKLFKPSNEDTRVFVHVISDDMCLGDQVSYHALVFALATPDMAYSLVRQALELELPTLIAVEEGLRAEAADYYGVSILEVISARKPELLVTQAATWFADNLGEHRMALAADFAFMRPALAQATITSTAKQNAVIATVFFLPGADLPVMTLNQVKMALQLAFIYGEELTLQRAAEAAVVVLSAYGSRAVARTATRDLPVALKWPVKIAVAFGTTLALGKALEMWLLHGPDISALDQPLPDIPSLGELAGKTPIGHYLPAALTHPKE